MMQIKEVVVHAINQLSPIVESPKLEAELLLSYILAVPRSYLYAHGEKNLLPNQLKDVEMVVNRRKKLEPLAYIIGEKEFWSKSFIVNENTLIPRPETEILVENILLAHSFSPPLSIVDLGTGSGIIAIILAVERPLWKITASDCHLKSLEVATLNAKKHDANHISFLQGSWCSALPSTRFDLIVSNPPYIAEKEWKIYEKGLSFEPYEALVSGKEGLNAIEEIITKSPNYLKSGGELWLEHGFTQHETVSALMKEAGFVETTSYKDLNGIFRITRGKYYIF